MTVCYGKSLLIWTLVSFCMTEAQKYWRPYENQRISHAIPQKPYPLNGYQPLNNFQVYHRNDNNNNQMYRNGVRYPQKPLPDDSWIVNAINGYNNQYYILPVTTEEPTTEQPETTSSAPETTTNYYKVPKLYDDYEDLITIAPANAVMVILCNIVAVIMIFMGGPITWVGRRSVTEYDHQDVNNDILSIQLLNDGLLYGSSSSSNNYCLQRVACEVPRHANVYAKAFRFLAWTAHILPIIPDNSAHLEEIADELNRSASVAIDGSNCNSKFPCDSIPNLDPTAIEKGEILDESTNL